MNGTVVVLFIVYFCIQELVTSIKLLELRVPSHVSEGGDTLLGCQFEMEDDILYSVKWYKNNREFYRYVPRNTPPSIYFATPGVFVDMSKSSSDVVSLTQLSPESAGLYRCEVSGEAPLFATVYDQNYISIHLLPKSGPQITGYQEQYGIGDRAVLNCSSPGSRPETHLKWLINDQPAPRSYLQGPWYRMSMERPDAVETILQIRFTVLPKHFQDGIIRLKCQATIAPMYQEEAVKVIGEETPLLSESSHSEDRIFGNLGSLFEEATLPTVDLENHTDTAEKLQSSSILVLAIFLVLEIW